MFGCWFLWINLVGLFMQISNSFLLFVMRGSFLLVFILLRFCLAPVIAQTIDSGFIKQWDELLKVDDNEKNFRFQNFIESVKEELVFSETGNTPKLFPLQWGYQFSGDSTLLVCSGVLPYEYQKSKLIVFIVDCRGEKMAYSFTRLLESVPTAEKKSEPKLIKTESGYSLDILIGTSSLINVPDLDLKILLSRLGNCRVDEQKVELSEEIWKRLKPLMSSEQYFQDSFNGYDELSTLNSQDGQIKICTWNIENNNGVNSFFGGLGVNSPSGIKTYELIDNYQEVRSPEQATLTPSKWYGAIYYDLIETKSKGNIYYTLIGYNGNNAFSQIKVVDVLVVSRGNNPNPRFGHSVFSDGKRTRRRLVFEYSNRAVMMLRYDVSKKMIVMDNLAPAEQVYQNDFRYYGPDFSYNGLKFEKGKWVLYTEIDIRNTAKTKNN